MRHPVSPSQHCRGRGSVMFLYPVGFLIILMLGAIAVDLGNVWLQQRRLADAADSAANDAVTYGVDQQSFRVTSELNLDPDRVAQIVLVSVAGQELPPAAAITRIDPGGTSAAGNPAVVVTIQSNADLIFGRLLRSGGIAIEATATAEITGGP